jgi:probable HAF family extracellular repeat protein
MTSKILMCITAITLFVALAVPLRLQLAAQEQSARQEQSASKEQKPEPVRYTVIDLGPVGNSFSQATWLNNHGLVTGFDTASDGTSHAVLWYKGVITDISKPGLGGPNSSAGGVNESGQVLGEADTSSKDPNNENFCDDGTGLQCLAFLWQNGVITPLPTLGGTNNGFGAINNRGEVSGFAENSTPDPECPSGVKVNGTGPQVLDFEAVIWGPKPGEIRELRPLDGDTVGIALGINDKGQAVGSSGTCANTYFPPFAAGPHAVLWEKDGSVHDLGNLGGTANPAVLGLGNVAFAINNRGQVTGISALSDSEIGHPFLWTTKKGMQDLGLLSGDVMGAGLDINNEGEVVGASVGGDGNPLTGSPRAFLWQSGVMSDLNALVPADTPLYLLTAFAINDRGEIAGFGVNSTMEVHAFLATPVHGEAASESAAQGRE